MSLAKEHEELIQVLSNERAQRAEDGQKISEQFRKELELMEEKRLHAEADRVSAESKRGIVQASSLVTVQACYSNTTL